MESTEVFASGASSVNDEAAPAGPITAIGRIWVFLGGVEILAGLANLAAASSIEILMADPKFAEGIATNPLYPYVGWILVHTRLLACVQLGLAAGVVAISVSFLRRMPWALPAMTAVHYLALVGLVAFGVWSNALWTEGVRWAGVPPAAAMAGPMTLFAALALFALPLILMLRSLHGSRVRASFEAAPRA